MNLSLSFCQTDNCKILNLIDCTNWRGSSYQIADVTAVEVTITSLGSTTGVTIDLIDILQEQLTGTASCTLGSRTITGVTTVFVGELIVGDSIIIGGNDYTIESIESNTSLTIKEFARTNSPGVDIYVINTTYEITSNDLVGTPNLAISDGIYNILYTVIAGGVTHIYESYQTLICQSECCIITRFSELAENYLTNPCDDKTINDNVMTYAMLKSMISSSKCGSSTGNAKILEIVQQLCQFRNEGCSSCD
ncbi:hypothetical protein CCP3SC1AL1_310007 [Gammaproteobacteria bacterium]